MVAAAQEKKASILKLISQSLDRLRRGARTNLPDRQRWQNAVNITVLEEFQERLEAASTPEEIDQVCTVMTALIDEMAEIIRARRLAG